MATELKTNNMPKFKENPGGMKPSGFKMKKAPYKHTSASHPTGDIAAHKGHMSKTMTKKKSLAQMKYRDTP